MISSLFLSPFGLVRASVTPRYESPATAAVVTPPLGTLLMPGEPLRLGQLQVREWGLTLNQSCKETVALQGETAAEGVGEVPVLAVADEELAS